MRNIKKEKLVYRNIFKLILTRCSSTELTQVIVSEC